MDDKMKTRFEASIFNLPRMRADSEQIAKDMGLSKKGQIDAFRHAYTSAKMREAFGEAFASAAGHGNEIGREVLGRIGSLGTKGNPDKEWDMDVHNNATGRNIERTIAEQKLANEEKERKLREEIAAAVKDGRLQTDPNAPPVKKSEQEEPVQTEVSQGKPRASILDYYKTAADEVEEFFGNIWRR